MLRKSWGNALYALLLMLLFVFVSNRVFAENHSRDLQPRRVLIISPFNVSFVQYYQMSASFLDRLNRSGTSYSLDRFDLDLHAGTCTPEKLAEFRTVARQIGDGRYRIVVCFGMPSLELFKSIVTTVPDSVSVLVCGISNLGRDQIPPSFGGVIQKVNVARNLELIQKLFPHKKKIILLTDWHETGRRIRAAAREAIRQFPDLKLIDIDNDTVSTEEMLQQVEAAGPDAVVLFQGWYNKQAVNAASLRLLMNAMGNKADIPLFVMHSSMLRFGTVGGYVEDGKKTGETAAELTLQILSNPKAFRVLELPAQTVLNDSMLRFYSIPDSNLPANAVILGREESFFSRNRKEICFAAGVVLLISILAGVSLFFAIRFRRLTGRMKAVFANLPVNVVVADKDENVLLYYGDRETAGADRKQIRKMKDFFPDLYPLLHEVVREVLNDGRHGHREYIRDGLHRRADCVYLPRKVFGRPAALWASVDIDLLIALSENEKLLNRCLASVMSDSNAETSLSAVLKTLCEHFHGDRCYLLHYDFEKGLIEPVDEYCSDGNQPEVSLWAPMPIPKNEEWFQKLFERSWVDYDVEAAEDLDREKGIWAKYIRQLGMRRLYTMPIFLHDKLWGNWGVSFEKKNVALSETSLQLIVSVGHMLELILQRQAHVAELSGALDQAQSATRAKSAFLATMSHELRTPLNAVIGFSELLAGGQVTPTEQIEYISGINLAGKALLGLINDILDFSKIEADLMEIVPVPTDLNRIFNELEAVFRQAVAVKGIALHFAVPPELPLLALDELRIRQILLNLIGNAVKYTPKGSVTVTAKYDRDGTLSISVADTGLGIKASAREKIFEPFVQQDAIRDTRIFQGTGLGLAIVKKLADRMRGRITLQSEVGTGSIFTLTLPAVKATARLEEASVPARPEEALRRMPKVLLVDDVPLNLKVMEAMFKRLNIHDVIKVSSAEEALNILSQHAVDIVFSDMWMPKMNGAELAEKIRSDRTLSGIKIVAVTADTECKNVSQAGFDAVLLKPITLERLKEILLRITQND